MTNRVNALVLFGASVLFLVGCVVLSQAPSLAQVWKWSQTAGTNSNADPNINWATGMSPSAVSPSARQMMAAVAQVRDDWSGANTTGGTAGAFTLTSNQGFDSLAHLDKQKLCFKPNNANTASATLSVDGLTAEPILTAPSAPVGAGVLLAGTPYCVTYVNADLAFYLQGFIGNLYNIPLGGILVSTVNSAPNSNFVFANGQAISRTTYSTYFGLVSTTYGSGNGTTTFNVPDLMARGIVGLDAMGGAAASNRITVAGGNFDATALGGSGGVQNKTLVAGNVPQVSTSYTPAGSISFNGGANINAGLVGQVGATNIVVSASNTGLEAVALTGAFSGTPATITVGSASPNSFATVQPAIALPVFVRVF